MHTPTRLELQHWLEHEYDPSKAHEYYLRTRKLKGRKKKRQQTARAHRRQQARSRSRLTPSQKAWVRRQEAARKFQLGMQKAAGQAKVEKQQAAEKARIEKKQAARLKQHKVLTVKIQDLETKLKKLEDLIAQKEREEASQSRKALFIARTDAREAAKPPTVAEKREAARESAQYRDQNQQKVKAAAARASTAAKGSSSSRPATSSVPNTRFALPSAGSAPTAAPSKKTSDVAKLKTLATKVKGELTVAKQKLAAL
jgi:hypothetical protein